MGNSLVEVMLLKIGVKLCKEGVTMMTLNAGKILWRVRLLTEFATEIQSHNFGGNDYFSIEGFFIVILNNILRQKSYY